MKALEELGLSKREIAVYLALLETGSTTVGPLVKKSNIPNSKIYETLEKLIRKGLVTYVIIKGKKTFQASPPKSLKNIIEDKERKLNKILPTLELRHKLAEKKQSAEVYEGIKGVQEALYDILNTLKRGEEYYVLGLEDEFQSDAFLQFIHQFHTKREKTGIKVKIIFEERSRKTIKKKYHVKNIQIKFSKNRFPTGVFIYNDKVMTLIWGQKPTMFVMQSEQTANRYKEFFTEMWEKSKK